jgi:uncharacterized membrane protein
MTILSLSTQRRDDQLVSYRDQLMLELAILSEQKAAKIIELLEELRRDDPNIHNRLDQEAETLSMPAEPQAILDGFKTAHEKRPNDLEPRKFLKQR